MATAFTGYVNLPADTSLFYESVNIQNDNPTNLGVDPSTVSIIRDDGQSNVIHKFSSLIGRMRMPSKKHFAIPDEAVLVGGTLRLWCGAEVNINIGTTNFSATYNLHELKSAVASGWMPDLANGVNYDGSTAWEPRAHLLGQDIWQRLIDTVTSTAGTAGAWVEFNLAEFVYNGLDWAGLMNFSMSMSTDTDGYGGSSSTNPSTKVLSAEGAGADYQPRIRAEYILPTVTPTPIITVTPDTSNPEGGFVNIVRSPSDTSHTKNSLGWATGSIGAVASQGSNTTELDDVGRTKIPFSEITGSVLATPTDNYNFTLYSEDSQNTDGNGAVSNTVSIVRPKVSSAVMYESAYGSPIGAGAGNIDIGTKYHLYVIADTGLDAGSYRTGGKYKYVWVNWDANVSNTFPDDYSKYTMPTEHTNSETGGLGKKISYTYTTSGAKDVVLVLEDVDGWMSPLTQITGNAPTPNEVVPVSVVTTSREHALSAQTGVIGADDSTRLTQATPTTDCAVVVNAQGSYPVGSDRVISEYKWSVTDRADGDKVVTSGCLDINNDILDQSTKRLYATCSKAFSNSDTVKIRLVGMASFDSSGNPVSDEVKASFANGYYDYVVEDISPGEDFFTGEGGNPTTPEDHTGGTEEQFGDGTDNYFKRVDLAFIYGGPDASDDEKEVYHIWANPVVTDAKTVSPDITTIVDSMEGLCVIPRLARDSTIGTAGGNSHSALGGYAKFVGGSGDDVLNFASHTDGRLKITAKRANHDWIGYGLAIGDRVHVYGSGFPLTDGFYTIAVMDSTDATASYLIMEEEYLDSDRASNQTATILATKPSLSLVSHYYEPDGHNVSCLVTDNNMLFTDATQQTSSAFDNKVNVQWDLPVNLDLDKLASDGDIAIKSSTLTTGNSLSSTMALGSSQFPNSTSQTKFGLPTVSMNIQILSQTGLRRIRSLATGGFTYALHSFKNIDNQANKLQEWMLVLQNSSITKDPSLANTYNATLSFIARYPYLAGE